MIRDLLELILAVSLVVFNSNNQFLFDVLSKFVGNKVCSFLIQQNLTTKTDQILCLGTAKGHLYSSDGLRDVFQLAEEREDDVY